MQSKTTKNHYPSHALSNGKYDDSYERGLIKCIVDYVRIKNGYVDRIQNSGFQYSENSGFINRGCRRGIADIHACIEGKHVSIEIKIGKDKQSEYQIIIENEIKAAKGLYWIIKDFESFYNYFKDEFPHLLSSIEK